MTFVSDLIADGIAFFVVIFLKHFFVGDLGLFFGISWELCWGSSKMTNRMSSGKVEFVLVSEWLDGRIWFACGTQTEDRTSPSYVTFLERRVMRPWDSFFFTEILKSKRILCNWFCL